MTNVEKPARQFLWPILATLVVLILAAAIAIFASILTVSDEAGQPLNVDPISVNQATSSPSPASGGSSNPGNSGAPSDSSTTPTGNDTPQAVPEPTPEAVDDHGGDRSGKGGDDSGSGGSGKGSSDDN